MRVAKSSFKEKGKKRHEKCIQKTRKQKRKEKRLEKKKGRQIFNQNKSKKKPDNEKLIKFEKADESEDDLQAHTGKKFKNIVQDKLKNEQELEKRKQKKLEIEMIKQRKKQLISANLEEDRTIRQLEKQLKIKKRKNNKSTSKSFASDGLDYILDFCDSENRIAAVETEKQLLGVDSESEFEEDFAVATGQILQKRKRKKIEKEENLNDSENSECNLDDESDFSSSFEKDKFKKLENKKEIEAQSESDNSENEEDDNSFSSENYDDITDEKCSDTDEIDIKNEVNLSSKQDSLLENNDCIEKKENINFWEDIYGRTRDKDGNIISNKYVPPAVRAKYLEQDSKNNEKLIQLKRQLKGPLNKLTDRNIQTISSQIDDLYTKNSRNNMNEMLTNLIIEALVLPTMTPNRLIIEHMMLIAVLHANVGSEVGSHFLLTIVRRIYQSLDSLLKVENKELDNLILMLSHLYNFKVFGSKLIYEILEKLAEKFTEKEIDLILLVLKNVGFILRKDDPISLKELITKLQQKASVTKDVNSRVKFMLDILLAIKNNNINKIPQYDPSIMDQMKKHIKTLIRKGNGIIQLNVTLDDLLKADEKGKWWIVGAAWSGEGTTTTKIEKSSKKKTNYSEKLLELARKQRMNTDLRRNIFCILMSAEDFLDAFEKLHHLGLKDRQEKEIIYVLMNCCLQEQTFNPYYAVLAQKFCDYDRKYQMTIQYTLWDKLKTLNTFKNRQLKNLALFLTHLFLHKGLSISTMKVIQLDELDKPKMKLVRQIILGILMHEHLETSLAVFERITRSEELKTFREALRLFINQFVIKNVEEGSIQNDKLSLIKKRSELVDRILTNQNSRIVF